MTPSVASTRFKRGFELIVVISEGGRVGGHNELNGAQVRFTFARSRSFMPSPRTLCKQWAVNVASIPLQLRRRMIYAIRRTAYAT